MILLVGTALSMPVSETQAAASRDCRRQYTQPADSFVVILVQGLMGRPSGSERTKWKMSVPIHYRQER